MLFRRSTRQLRNPPRPRVLQVTNMWPHAGNPAYGIFVRRQVESLEALGIGCDSLFVEGYRSRWAYPLAAARMFALNFSRRRPALIHAHGGETALVARCYLRGPVVVSYCGDDLLGTPRANGRLTRASRIRRAVLRQHARTITATITKSSEMQSALPASARRRNRVVPNGVDRSLFRPMPREDARRKLGWGESELVALFAADPAVERKRYWLADAACKAAKKSLGEIRLAVAWGTPPGDMPLLMAASDCLLLTSAIEGSPNVVKEAIACDLPVVSTDVGDVRRLLEGVEPSWIPGDEPDALGDALLECLSRRARSNGHAASEWLGQDAAARVLQRIYFDLSPDLRGTAA